MFTGIVAELGEVAGIEQRGDAARLTIRGSTEDVSPGESIAVNGVGLALGAAGALSPVLAAVAHNASSVFVALNSSRLVRYRLEPARQETAAAPQPSTS